ncbi:hypothetical protein SSYRP_v1c07620 [Spiroplasma syrphidicola EA-1]|uniref:SGNH hydrolase-type esterase domain-containing protein n=1 Tax=Spiroplasma syrphidicola EA-1 TaxID=1276229 RepID=R4U4E8_9MOLU|nr:GDSL-type esterase/lipase family protein [Spiroplasma syrphidicola]AGM26352.1 hypothetical protein SSYRP_v1c07620 [Spiroplasma syrphidicola EA-1]
MKQKKIAILGDSLTFGYLPMGRGQMAQADNWPVKLKDLLQEHYQDYEITLVINAWPGRTIVPPRIDFGFPQDNGQAQVPKLLQQAGPFDLFIVFLGTNDFFGEDAYQKMTGEKDNDISKTIVDNLSQLLKQMASLVVNSEGHKKYQELIICPPKVITKTDGELLTDLPAIFEAHFANAGVGVVNLQQTANPQPEDYQNYDGIHYTVQETRAVAQAIFNKIVADNLLAIN